MAELRSDSCSLAPRRRWYEPAAIVAPKGPQGFVPLEMPSVALSESLRGLLSFGESSVAVHEGNCVAEPVIGWLLPPVLLEKMAGKRTVPSEAVRLRQCHGT